MTPPVSRTLAAHERDGLLYYGFPALEKIPFVRHGFSTRLGGVSEGIFRSMNLSFTRGDREEAVRENFRRFSLAIGVEPDSVVVSAQTHTTNVISATAADRGRGVLFPREYTDVDGMMTDEPGVTLCTQYADCVPLFFADPVRRVVATSHAGWRGTAGNIGAVTVDRMHRDYGCEPQDILVGIGPSIGGCCFEVDAPVYEAFAKTAHFSDDCATDDGNGKYHIDLWAVNRRGLLLAGVRPEHITVTDLCTRCHPEIFWSHRFCGAQRGSLAGFIGMVE